MATIKNTNDLLSQASTDLADNTTQKIKPVHVRDMAENLAFSSYNKLTDASLVGLKAFSVLPVYEAGQGTLYNGKIYISNQVTGPGAFNSAHWNLYGVDFEYEVSFVDIEEVLQLFRKDSSITGINSANVDTLTYDKNETGTFTPVVLPLSVSAGDTITWKIIYSAGKTKASLNIIGTEV